MTDTLSELPSIASRLTPAARRPQAVRLSSSRTVNDPESGQTGSSLFHPERAVPGRLRAATASQAQPRSIWNTETRQTATTDESVDGSQTDPNAGMGRIGRRRRAISNAVASRLGWGGGPEEEVDPETRRLQEERAHYDRQVVDLLDVIDPEVSTLSTLSDLQNSLFIPNLGRFVDRSSYLRIARPTETTPEPGTLTPPGEGEKTDKKSRFGLGRASKKPDLPALEETPSAAPEVRPTPTQRRDADEADEATIAAQGKYLILPDGLVDWDKWSDEERAELDDYVRHLLHSRKWKARRTWRGFKHYVRTPLGAFVTIYASLLTFWGAAWVLFIIGWLNAGSRQAYFVEICDQILTALFCTVGIGLAPFRAVDTYHMSFIARLHRKSLRLYKERGDPALSDENDLPDPTQRAQQTEGSDNVRAPVLTVQEQATLIYHQTKFARSHSFYRPHETATHRAFPLDLLIVVVLLLDFHSIFQIALGSTTWSISYHHDYKKILTSIILSISITTNITAGLVIVVGNRRTRKTEVIEKRLRQAVTAEAIKRREAHKRAQEHGSHNDHPTPLSETERTNTERMLAAIKEKTKSH